MNDTQFNEKRKTLFQLNEAMKFAWQNFKSN